jgi:hypothetical protein
MLAMSGIQVYIDVYIQMCIHSSTTMELLVISQPGVMSVFDVGNAWYTGIYIDVYIQMCIHSSTTMELLVISQHGVMSVFDVGNAWYTGIYRRIYTDVHT